MRRRLLTIAALAAGIAIVPTVGPAMAATPAPAPTAAPTASAPLAAEKDPILFVHGFTGQASNWDYVTYRFRLDGYTDLNTFTYDSLLSNVEIAEQVKAEVVKIRERTGAPRVDIVSHSMGSLSSRYFVKNLGGNGMVDDFVSLAGANHGTWAAAAPECFTVSCKEMIPGSAFLTALNAEDETPGRVNYSTFYSATDGVIIPFQSTILNGATNTEVANVTHNQFLADAGVYTQIKDAVRF